MEIDVHFRAEGGLGASGEAVMIGEGMEGSGTVELSCPASGGDVRVAVVDGCGDGGGLFAGEVGGEEEEGGVDEGF